MIFQELNTIPKKNNRDIKDLIRLVRLFRFYLVCLRMIINIFDSVSTSIKDKIRGPKAK